jgi:hypothetical protein
VEDVEGCDFEAVLDVFFFEGRGITEDVREVTGPVVRVFGASVNMLRSEIR